MAPTPHGLCLRRTKALVLELLAAVCLVRGGHDIILAAFDNFKEVSLWEGHTVSMLSPLHVPQFLFVQQSPAPLRHP